MRDSFALLSYDLTAVLIMGDLAFQCERNSDILGRSAVSRDAEPSMPTPVTLV